MEQKSICIAPLDWGLGHATRCITLIRALELLHYKIYIATSGKQEAILKENFPNATFLSLSGYNIKYTKKKSLFVLTFIFQLPKILIAIIHEYFWLKKIAKEFSFDLIIADNRYGFFHQKIKSVFITHQLSIQTPFGWSSRWVQKIVYYFIHQFNACWIADMKPPHHIAGQLSNAQQLPHIPIWYMNCLSRLHTDQNFIQNNTSKEPSNNTAIKFLGIVSGPEPQRTLFENLLWEQGRQLNLPFTIVAGLPNDPNYQKVAGNARVYHHLGSADLLKEIQNAEYIICRGGYTTLMELIPFKKKLIIIPTPGQTEQEYLGKYWTAHHWAICYEQSSFSLNEAIEKANTFNYSTPPFISFSIEALATELKRLSL